MSHKKVCWLVPIDRYEIPTFDIKILEISGQAMWEFEGNDLTNTVYDASSIDAFAISMERLKDHKANFLLVIVPTYGGFEFWRSVTSSDVISTNEAGVVCSHTRLHFTLIPFPRPKNMDPMMNTQR